jgi:hypothetical protein
VRMEIVGVLLKEELGVGSWRGYLLTVGVNGGRLMSFLVLFGLTEKRPLQNLQQFLTYHTV